MLDVPSQGWAAVRCSSPCGWCLGIAPHPHTGEKIDVDAVAERSAKEWLKGHLRFVDPETHMIYQNELKEGSPELTDIFEREIMGANDTSAAVGYAPLTETATAEKKWTHLQRKADPPGSCVI